MAAKPIAPFRPDEAFGLALMIYGLFLLPMGLLAFAMPALSAPSAALSIGCLFMVAGIAGIGALAVDRRERGFWAHLAWTLIAVAAGAILIMEPVMEGPAIARVLGGCFVAQGGVAVVYALQHRRGRKPSYLWILAGGAGTALVGVLLLAGLSLVASTPAVVTAVDMISFGVSVIYASMQRAQTH